MVPPKGTQKPRSPPYGAFIFTLRLLLAELLPAFGVADGRLALDGIGFFASTTT